MKYILLISLLFLVSCKEIPYKEDTYYTSSREAFSPEYLIFVNGSVCKDADGIVGFCAKRLKRNVDLVVDIAEQQYSYEVEFDCSNSVQPTTEKWNVPKNKPFRIVLPQNNYSTEKVFNCSVSITATDRPEPIGAFARISVVLVDDRYIELEKPFKYNNQYYIFSQYAYYVYWYDGIRWHWGKELTMLKNKKVEAAFIESHNMRFSSEGL